MDSLEFEAPCFFFSFLFQSLSLYFSPLPLPRIRIWKTHFPILRSGAMLDTPLRIYVTDFYFFLAVLYDHVHFELPLPPLSLLLPAPVYQICVIL